jgi:hypothetical protein
MSHLKDIMLLKEEEMDRAVFVRDHQEGGINTIYDPLSDKDVYQVFVHQNFPMRELSSWEFVRPEILLQLNLSNGKCFYGAKV